MANTINSGETEGSETRGSTIPAAVIAATVADPTDTRIAAAMSQARRRGDALDWRSNSPRYSLIPLATKISFRLPAPAIIK